MKRLLLPLLFVAFNSISQNLVTSRRSSYYTFIYKLTNKEAQILYKGGEPEKSFFNSLLDFYPADSSYKKELTTGHYLLVNSVNDEITYELQSVNNTSLYILDNQRDLIFTLSDSTGNRVENASIYIRNKEVRFSPKNNSYILKKTNKDGLIEVLYRGHASYFNVERKYNNTFFVRIGRRIVHTFPINHLVSLVAYPVRTAKNLIKGNYIYPPGIYYRIKRGVESNYERDYPGYVVSNKPMYKPGDTVKLKAFFTKKNGTPIKHTLDLLLNNNGYSSINKKIASIKPYRPGAYVFEFVLHDSLKLSLDTNPSIYFEKNNKHITSHSFRFEDYELNGNQYYARSENTEKNKGGVLFLKGSDTNDLPLYDVRAEILIKPQQVDKIFINPVFVPDTLWYYTQRLDPIGETKISIPDSVFPNVDMKYNAFITFLNTENERQVKEINLEYSAKEFPIKMEIRNDSIIFFSKENEIAVFEITALDAEDNELYTKKVRLPYRERINPYINEYQAGVDKTWKFFSMQGLDKLSPLATRTSDSVIVTIDNPHSIEYYYQIYRNKKIVYRGSDNKTGLIYKNKCNEKDNYSIAVQYVWAGESKSDNYTVPFNARKLEVSISHPTLIYPGQHAELTVLVKDAFGKPIEDADVTALAVTKKFIQTGYHSVPSFEKKQKQRFIFNQFNAKEFEELSSEKLDWIFWRKMLGLDSIEYYKFLYPENGKYNYTLSSSDTITQVAPFIVQDGKVLMPIVIYINNQPVFYDGVNTPEPYSFRTVPGKNKIEIRLPGKLITIPDAEIIRHEKSIISIDLDHLPKGIFYKEMPTSLTDEEKKKFSRYFVYVQRKAGQSEAYINQRDRYFHFNSRADLNGRQFELIGPLHPQQTSFVIKDNFKIDFNFEPFFSYEFEKNLIRQRSQTNPLASRAFRPITFSPSFSQKVITLEQIQAQWDIPKLNSVRVDGRYSVGYSKSKVKGRLFLYTKPSTSESAHVCTFIINLDNPDQYFIYPSYQRDFDSFEPAHYEVVVLYSDQRYVRSGKFLIKPYGQTFIDLKEMAWKPQDSFSLKWIEILKSWEDKTTYVEQVRNQDLQDLRGTFYAQPSQEYQYHTNVVSGQVISADDGSPMPGVNVMIRGTSIGTVTDVNGVYSIGVAPNDELVFSFIGLTSTQTRVGNRSRLDIAMQADVTQLNEVVVVGYSVQYKRELAGSIATISSSLAGRVAGVQFSGAPGANNDIAIRLRGASSLAASGTPIVIIDGVIFSSSKIQELDQNSISAIEVLNSEQAIAIYGARAANGVILISTQKGITSKQLLQTKLPSIPIQISIDGNVPGSSLRKNFRDYAFWKPRLFTDRNGKATFTTTFPDDITGWKAEALVMASGKKSGQAESTIQSYKPVIAQIVAPQFLILGDSASGIGKITNYTQGELPIVRSIEIGNSTKQDLIQLTNSVIDSIQLSASSLDSIKVKYSINYNNYDDGELRKINVLPKGIKEAEGVFLSLRNDTTFTINPKQGTLKLYAQADLLDVLLEEIESVKSYSYDCNEQLASKLKVLLAEKKIKQFKKEEFLHELQVRRIINNLQKNQNKDGSWSWWEQGDGFTWITIYVTTVLEAATKEGFQVRFDRQGAINFIQKDLFNTEFLDRIDPFIFLANHNIKVDSKPLLDSISRYKNLSVYTQLKLLTLEQVLGKHSKIEWLDSLKKETIKGNYYWGETATNLFDNDIQCTLLGYKLKEAYNASDDELSRIRNFFLEKRKRSWRNTFESAKIIDTILPTLLQSSQRNEITWLSLTGGANLKVVKFPFELETKTIEPITVSKVGSSPVYFTAYHEFWNNAPEKSDKDFIVETRFEDNLQTLQAGKPIKLYVNLTVKKDAEYIMIDVPIPSGCSYENKPQSRKNGEVHRESYSYKTSIFCQALKQGYYQYEISLIPRYKGSYTLNPARAELMYFPVIHGNETVKRVEIK